MPDKPTNLSALDDWKVPDYASLRIEVDKKAEKKSEAKTGPEPGVKSNAANPPYDPENIPLDRFSPEVNQGEEKASDNPKKRAKLRHSTEAFRKMIEEYQVDMEELLHTGNTIIFLIDELERNPKKRWNKDFARVYQKRQKYLEGKEGEPIDNPFNWTQRRALAFALQKELNENEYDYPEGPIKVDGKLGPGTLLALKWAVDYKTPEERDRLTEQILEAERKEQEEAQKKAQAEAEKQKEWEKVTRQTIDQATQITEEYEQGLGRVIENYQSHYAHDLQQEFPDQISEKNTNTEAFNSAVGKVATWLERGNESNVLRVPQDFDHWQSRFREALKAGVISQEEFNVLLPEKARKHREWVQNQPRVRAREIFRSKIDIKPTQETLKEQYAEWESEYKALIVEGGEAPGDSPLELRKAYDRFNQIRSDLKEARALSNTEVIQKLEPKLQENKEALLTQIKALKAKSLQGLERFTEKYDLPPNALNHGSLESLITNLENLHNRSYAKYKKALEGVLLARGRTQFFGSFKELLKGVDVQAFNALRKELMENGVLALDEDAMPPNANSSWFKRNSGWYSRRWKEVGYVDNIGDHNAARLLELFNIMIATKNLRKLKGAKANWFLNVK